MATTHILGDNVPRKSKVDLDLASKLAKYYEEHPEGMEKKIPPTLISNPVGECILMPQTSTYALGVHALQDACIKENNQNHPKFTFPDGRVVYRPLTFKENCLARLNQFYTFHNADGSPRNLGERMMGFLERWNNSCGSIAYPAPESHSHKFKLILQDPNMIGISINFNDHYFPIDYSSLPYTRELDRNEAQYNDPLTPTEIINHEGWLTLFEDDATTLQDYQEMVEEAMKLRYPMNPPQRYMDFRLLNQAKEYALTIYVNCLNENSFANGGNFTSGGSFLRVLPK